MGESTENVLDMQLLFKFTSSLHTSSKSTQDIN